MSIHDWTRVDAGTYHDFHLGWIAELRRALNGGLLPEGYYAQAERQASRYEADLLALERTSPDDDATSDDEPSFDPPGDAADGTAVATLARPRLSVAREADDAIHYAMKRRTIAVRHASGDRLVALLELASPGNKDRRSSGDAFVAKAVDALSAGVHVAVIDLFPPRRSDGPGGLGGAVADAAGFAAFDWPADKPLAIASFEAVRPPDPLRLYAEPLAVGDAPPDLPLFYARGRYADVPLAATYAAAYDATPRRWRAVIEA